MSVHMATTPHTGPPFRLEGQVEILEHGLSRRRHDLIFVLLSGSTLFLLRGIVETVGLYLANLPQLAFWNDMLSDVEPGGRDWGWQGSWTVFYWAWTVTWSPFMGLFVARISKGRTIREFVMGVLLALSLFTLLWLAIFGCPARIRGAFAATFFATSSDSASRVVDMLCTGKSEAGPVQQRLFRGISEGAIGALLIMLAGEAGLVALQQVITVVGLPIFCLVFLMIPAIIKGLITEDSDHVTVGPRPQRTDL